MIAVRVAEQDAEFAYACGNFSPSVARRSMLGVVIVLAVAAYIGVPEVIRQNEDDVGGHRLCADGAAKAEARQGKRSRSCCLGQTDDD
jgi:hypothetical protein